MTITDEIKITHDAILAGLQAALGDRVFDVTDTAGETQRMAVAVCCSVLAEDLASLTHAVAVLEGRLQVQTQRAKDAVATAADLASAEGRIDELLRERGSLQTEIGQLRHEHARLEAENRELRARLRDQATLEAQVRELRAAVKATKRLEDLRQEIAAGMREPGQIVVRTFIRDAQNGLVQTEIQERL